MTKKNAKELSLEEMEDADVDWGEELFLDIQRGTQTLGEDDQAIVEKSREALLQTLGLLTSSTPAEPTEEWAAWAYDLIKHAMYFRNCVRGCYLKSEGYEMPEKWQRLEGSIH